MFLERFQRVGFVVLGADGQDHAATAEFADVFLERGVGLAERGALAERDAFQTVIADHAAPEGVVEIEHEAFERPALLRGDPAADQIAVQRAGGRRDFLLRAVPQCRIVPFADSVAGGAVIDGEDIDAFGLRHGADRRVQPGYEPGSGSRQPMFVVAKHRKMHRQGGLLEDRTAERFARQAPDLADPILHFGQGRLRGVSVHPGGDAGGQVIGVQRDAGRRSA